MSIELKDKLYTSTQVADILGVSLRTLYRYMEDGKIQSMRTASGRHRFTKDQILDFLNAGGFGGASSNSVDKSQSEVGNRMSDPEDVFTSPSISTSTSTTSTTESVDVVIEKKPEVHGMDWFSEPDEPQIKPVASQDLREPTFNGFRSAEPEIKPVVENPISATSRPTMSQQGMNQDTAQSTSLSDNSNIEAKNESLDLNDVNVRYYKSDYSDLIELARKIKDTAMGKDLEYAFTLFAGLSLHFSIKPFTKLHFYANPEDMQIWKSELRLTPVQNREDANIGILVNTDIVFVPSKDIGGFKVVDDKVLMRDLSSRNEEDLVKQFRQHLMSA